MTFHFYSLSYITNTAQNLKIYKKRLKKNSIIPYYTENHLTNISVITFQFNIQAFGMQYFSLTNTFLVMKKYSRILLNNQYLSKKNNKNIKKKNVVF